MPRSENANIIQNDLGFVTVIHDYLQKNEYHLTRCVINAISLILTYNSAISKFSGSIYLDALLEAIECNRSEITRVCLDSLAKLFELYPISKKSIPERSLNKIREAVNSDEFKLRVSAVNCLTSMAKFLNDFQILTFSCLESIADILLSAANLDQKINILENLSQIIEKTSEETDPTSVTLAMRDSGIYDSAQELLDEEDEHLVQICDSFLEKCNENDFSFDDLM